MSTRIDIEIALAELRSAEAEAEAKIRDELRSRVMEMTKDHRGKLRKLLHEAYLAGVTLTELKSWVKVHNRAGKWRELWGEDTPQRTGDHFTFSPGEVLVNDIPKMFTHPRLSELRGKRIKVAPAFDAAQGVYYWNLGAYTKYLNEEAMAVWRKFSDAGLGSVNDVVGYIVSDNNRPEGIYDFSTSAWSQRKDAE